MKEELQKDIARLESVNDHILTELQEVHKLLKEVGFAEGIIDLKDAAEEMASLEPS